MKRLILLTAILSLFVAAIIPTTEAVAVAESTTLVTGEYLKVDESVTLISANFSKNEIFTVPASYYVQYLGYDEDNEIHLFKYMDVEGTLSDSDVQKLSKQTDSDFQDAETDRNPNLDLTVVTDITDVSIVAIKSTKNGKKTEVSVADFSAGTAFTFYGFLNHDATDYAFVKGADGSYWYIPTSVLLVTSVEGSTVNAERLSSYTLPQHYYSRPPVEIIDPSDNQNSGDTSGSNNLLNVDNNVLRIMLIIGIVLPAVIIMFLLFKPVAKKKGGYDYDRNRSYDQGPSPYDQPRSRYRDDDYYDRRYRRDDRYDNRDRRDDRNYRDDRDYRDYRDYRDDRDRRDYDDRY